MVCASTSSGTSCCWTKVNSGLPSVTINALAVKGDSLFAGTNGSGVFRSTDSGASWTAVNTGLTNNTIYALVVNSNDLFAGTNGSGVFRSTDNGTNWAAFNTGLTDLNIRSFAVGVGYLFAGTNTSGVWRWYLGETSVKKPRNYLFEQFNLLTRNQSNVNISISFSLPRSSPVQLKIYNLSGHLIATLLDKLMDAGSHSVSWDTRRLAAGCYMVRMQAGATTRVKSIPLVK
jgi:hypothetical protein